MEDLLLEVFHSSRIPQIYKHVIVDGRKSLGSCAADEKGIQHAARHYFILSLDNKCHFATVGRQRGIYFFILSKEESFMEQDGNIALNQEILSAIPKDVLDDIPKRKADEFRRGVLLCRGKETPELYQEAECLFR